MKRDNMPHCNKRVMSFFLTNKCNMQCKYCYTPYFNEKQTLDPEFAKCAIDDYMGNGDIRHIRFFASGEPTLEMDLMKDILDHARKIAPDVVTELQTNGYFNSETAKWVADNIDIAWISYDLTSEAHDAYRITPDGRGTSERIEENLRYFRDRPDKRAMVGVRATVNKYNVDDQKEGIKNLIGLGITNIWVDPIFPVVEKKREDGERPVELIDLMYFARKFVEAREFARSQDPKIFYESNLTASFDGETNINCRACVPMPHLTTDGYVTACDMAMFGEGLKHMDVFAYGRYDKERDRIEYDQDRIRLLRSRTLENMNDECQLCIARKHCAGYCPGEVQNECSNMFALKENVCAPIKYIYSKIGNDYGEFGGEFEYKHP